MTNAGTQPATISLQMQMEVKLGNPVVESGDDVVFYTSDVDCRDITITSYVETNSVILDYFPTINFIASSETFTLKYYAITPLD